MEPIDIQMEANMVLMDGPAEARKFLAELPQWTGILDSADEADLVKALRLAAHSLAEQF